jgi:glycosyltransferase involved in cell wall biosynthesis
MALRLTDAPSSASDRRSAAPAAEATIAARLQARAGACLARGDVGGYRALFAEADVVASPHRRHQARCALLEAGLGVRASATGQVAAAFAAVARHAIELLEAEPREPVVLNLAGIALYELGELGGAEALFKAARRLDPALPHVDRNLAEVARRRKARSPQPKLPVPVLRALRELAPRAKACAASARPVEGLTLSLCMIVKDEEEMLPRCLAAVRDAVDEIIVVDTGSSDRTREIALGFGARVLDVPWTGSFGDARNASFEAATGDWVMYLDADEVLVEGEAQKLRELCGRTWREAFYLVETNHTGHLEDGTAVHHNALRVFRNRPEYRFEGRIHEQIAQHLPVFLPERIELTDVRVEHFGYLGVVRDAREKSRRNLELLQRQAAEGLDDAFLHFNLGSEYAAILENHRALAHFERAWAKVEEDPRLLDYGYAPSLAGRYVRALRICGRPEQARRRAEEVLRAFPGYTDVVLEAAFAARALGDDATAAAELERCLEMGDAPSRYSATVGCGSYLALAALADLRRDAGDLSEAERLLRAVRAEHPTFFGAVDPLAALLLARGVAPADVVAAVEGPGGELPAMARFLLAVPLHEHGAPVEAEVQLRAVLAAHPGADAARVALGETLLSQGRLADARAAVEVVDEGSPSARAAARTLLFARLADEASTIDETGLAADLARAERAGTEPAERDAFAAWAAVRGGAAVPGALPPAAAEPVLTMLEALVHLEAFDAFGWLVPVLDAVAIPWRQRRERLADLYLRCGFLESAADEWIAVCEASGPDAAALAGLAQVAAARGMAEDAEILAREAQALQPDHPVAAGVLAAVAA